MTAVPAPDPTPARAPDLPSVAVVVVNFNGRSHLRDCFDSLARLDYPAHLVEVVCVDNASSDGSVEYITSEFPSVKLVRSPRNLGFAGGSNLGARKAGSELVAFLNNDMKVDPGWLRELVATIDVDAGVVCAAGRILNWEGDQLDFVRGAINFHGNASQTGSGFPSEWFPDDPEDLIFACGGSMLTVRSLFIEIGGFDEDFFAYFEDVDFGWRLWVMGYRVTTAPASIVYHRGHATAGALTSANREHLMEQNALAMLVKNVGDQHLGTLLSSSLMLLIRRSSIAAGIKPEHFSPGAPDSKGTAEVDHRALAILSAANDVIGQLDKLLEKRAFIQDRRRRSDAEVFARFARPFKPQGRIDAYLMSQASIVNWLGISDLFPEREAGMVMVIGETSRRFEELWGKRASPVCRALSACWEVTLAGPPLLTHDRVRTVDCSDGEERLNRLLDSHEVLILHAGYLESNPAPPGHVVIVDLAGVDLNVDQVWLRRLAEAGDAFLVPDRAASRQWRELVRGWGGTTPEVVVEVPVDAEPQDMHDLVNLCRHPYPLWAARGRRRLARYTEEVEVLLSDRDKQIVDLQVNRGFPLRALVARFLPAFAKRGIRRVLGVLDDRGLNK